VFFDETRWYAVAAILPCAGFWSGAERDQQVAEADIQQLSIEQLANVEITSVSKAPRALSTAAPVHVTSNDDAVRTDRNFPASCKYLPAGAAPIAKPGCSSDAG
jgi:hypothetical protein